MHTTLREIEFLVNPPGARYSFFMTENEFNLFPAIIILMANGEYFNIFATHYRYNNKTLLFSRTEREIAKIGMYICIRMHIHICECAREVEILYKY